MAHRSPCLPAAAPVLASGSRAARKARHARHVSPTPPRWPLQYHYLHPLPSRLFLADRSLVVAHSAYFLLKWELFRYPCMAAGALPKATRLLKSYPKCSSLFIYENIASLKSPADRVSGHCQLTRLDLSGPSLRRKCHESVMSIVTEASWIVA